MEFIILTGMSGSGKSQAADALEDMGYLCVDNMPVSFLPQFAEIYGKTPNKSKQVVFVIDVRGEIEFSSVISEIEKLKESGHFVRTVFIDCDDNTIISRYKETRRIHPLVPILNVSMSEAIKQERKLLMPIFEYADIVINSSRLSVRELHERVMNELSLKKKRDLIVTLESFGFKYGLVNDADLVFDVRCFPNPYYVESLKNKTGLDKEVSDYVFSDGQADEFLSKLYPLLDFLLPKYVEEGKTHLTLAVGCTGGKHRSVAIAVKLNEHLSSKYKTVLIHRDHLK